MLSFKYHGTCKLICIYTVAASISLSKLLVSEYSCSDIRNEVQFHIVNRNHEIRLSRFSSREHSKLIEFLARDNLNFKFWNEEKYVRMTEEKRENFVINGSQYSSLNPFDAISFTALNPQMVHENS